MGQDTYIKVRLVFYVVKWGGGWVKTYISLWSLPVGLRVINDGLVTDSSYQSHPTLTKDEAKSLKIDSVCRALFSTNSKTTSD